MHFVTMSKSVISLIGLKISFGLHNWPDNCVLFLFFADSFAIIENPEDIMKKVLVCLFTSLILFACSSTVSQDGNDNAFRNTGALAGSAYDPGAGWVLQWSDEFDGSSVNTSKWDYDIGGSGWGNNELQYYTSRPENASVQNGELTIKTLRENYGGKSFTSARLKTLNKFSARFGKVAARIKLPYGKGIWPAFWMLGEGFNGANWPYCGEIDITELKGGYDNIIYSTVHYDNYGSYAYQGGQFTNSEAFHLNYHIFEIEWDTNTIRWKLNGVQYYSLNISSRTMSEFQFPFFILLNTAVGGNFFNPAITDPAQVTAPFPQVMAVDWVRVYAPNFSLPPAPNGSQDVSVFSETHTGVNVLSTGATVDQWANTVTISQTSTAASEGSTGLKVTVGNAGWMGFGVSAYNIGHDLSAYTGSVLKFDIKTTSQKSYKVGLKSGSTTEAWVTLTSAMGYVADGQWRTVTIPISSFTGLKFNMISQYFMFASANGSQSGDVINIDNIYWQKTGTASSSSSVSSSSSSAPASSSSSLSSSVSSSASSTPSGDYQYGVQTVNSNTAVIWFKSLTTPSAVWVDAHYKVNNGGQLNYRMTYNSSAGRWEQTVTGLASGSKIDFFYTYEKSGLAYDTAWFTATFQPPASSSSSSTVVSSSSSSSVSSAASSSSSVVSSSSSSSSSSVSGPDYECGVTMTGGATAVIWFKSKTVPAALWVDAHYKVNGGTQQNFRMTYNSSAGRWEQTVTGLASGSKIDFFYTYEKSGLAYDTAWFVYTTPPADYTQGVAVVNSTRVKIWFKSATSPLAKWVDVHYKVNGGTQQNFRMTYSSSAARWEQTVSSLKTGSVIDYYFTYEKNGLAADTGWFKYTK